MDAGQGYRRDIDGLRAVAVAAIVIHHAFPDLPPGGFVGVDIFFVISGFLITRLIAEARDAGTFFWGGFYLRRARRIIPAYLLVVLVTSALAAWMEMPRLLAMTGAATAASGLFAANILFTQTAGYFAPGAQQSPLLHLWSLGVEEQFYLVWPALVALLCGGLCAGGGPPWRCSCCWPRWCWPRLWSGGARRRGPFSACRRGYGSSWPAAFWPWAWSSRRSTARRPIWPG